MAAQKQDEERGNQDHEPERQGNPGGSTKTNPSHRAPFVNLRRRDDA
jgi:hypothetical protein